MNDTAFYPSGQHVLCLPNNPMMRTGFCVFAQFAKGGGGVTGREVKGYLRMLVRGGCEMCGSVGMGGERGGLLTVNYVADGACGGVCREGGG